MEKIRAVSLISLVGAIGVAGCDAISSHTDVVARVGPHELHVDQVASWLSDNPRLPASTDVVEAVANLWIDYILIATEAARDSTLAGVDLSLLIRPQVEQEVVWKLRDRVIQADTTITDEELREQYEREQPGVTVRARHILLRLEPDAPEEERQRVRARLEEIRERVLAGEDFAELARQYSEDPGSAADGGDLDFFGRGQMVLPFEEAAFALEVGEVSDIVETPFGLHIIKLEERRVQDFEEVRDQYRDYVIETRLIEAEEAYIEQLTSPLDIRVQESAFDVVRELASNPGTRLSNRAAGRALVTYRDGALTASEFLEFLRMASQAQRSQIAAATDDQIDAVLRGLTRNEILVAEAERLGLSLTDEELGSLTDFARQQVVAATVNAGLNPVVPREGETVTQAVERQVESLLRDIIRQERNVISLGPVIYPLREERGATVYERAFPAVIARVEAAQPATGTPSPESSSGQ